jgi:hypothetical protein
VYSTSDLNAMFDNWQQELDAKIASITSQVELDPISSDEDEDSLESDVEEEQEDESFEGSVCSEECEESFESESVQDPANSSKSTHNIEVGTSEERQCKEPFKEPADASFRASIEDVKEQDETSQKRASEEQQQAISETIEPISKKCQGSCHCRSLLRTHYQTLLQHPGVRDYLGGQECHCVLHSSRLHQHCRSSPHRIPQYSLRV